MSPLTFPCPACGRLMGVPLETAGRPVRCPHCHQVVTAPAAAGPGYPPAAAGFPASAAAFAPLGPPSLPPPAADPFTASPDADDESPTVGRRAGRRRETAGLPWKEAAIAVLALYGAGATAVAVRLWTRPLPAPAPPASHPTPAAAPPAKAK